MNYEMYKAALGDEEKTLEFRKIVGARSVFSEERQHLALEIARNAFDRRDFGAAEPWALRALNDGPSIDVLCLLGDICQDTGDLENALHWYELACECKVVRRFDDPDVAAFRWSRVRAIERMLREDWESRAPLRELNFDTQQVGALLMAGFGGQSFPGRRHYLGPFQSPWMAFVNTVVLDDDLEFIAFAPDLKLPHEPNLPHAMWVLPVKEVPEFGDVLLLSPWAAETASKVKNKIEFWMALPEGAKFGAFTGKL